MKNVDYVIAGGGASGLGLAYQIVNSSLHGKSILILERDAKDRNDRTWCFWTDQPTPLEHLVYRNWSQVEVVSDDFQRIYDLQPYTYKMIRGIDYYQGMRDALTMAKNIQFQQARVNEIIELNDKSGAVAVINNNEHVGGRWVFDSIYKTAELYQGPARYHYLKQHFKGWEIETASDCFDPGMVTLFDFRTPQKGSMRFFYILPFDKRRAMVEYTIFSANVLKPNEYDRAISEYLEDVRHIASYRIAAVETGVIPMTDRPFKRQLSEHCLAIGTKGGLVKPSSGYAFLRMQKDAAAIVRSLINYDNPFHIPAAPARYRLFDRIMLQVMYRQGDRMKGIFTQMFQNNSIQNIFAFLDETAPLGQNIRLLASLPTAPFLKALFRVKFLQKV